MSRRRWPYIVIERATGDIERFANETDVMDYLFIKGYTSINTHDVYKRIPLTGGSVDGKIRYLKSIKLPKQDHE